MLIRHDSVSDALRQALLDTPARDLHRLFDGPALLHFPGRREPAVFVSVLLHGNEDVGLGAVQQLLRDHARRSLPRSLWVLIGNVRAAREGVRRLDDQPDYNRVWPGAPATAGGPEQAMMAALHAEMLARGLFATVDLHNNTGLNPHYAIVNRLDAASLTLARLFSRTVVWFRGVPGTQTAAFAPHVPAVALECGQPGHRSNEEAAARHLDACLHLAAFPDHAPDPHELDLYRNAALVKVRPEIDFGFGTPDRTLDLDPRLDHLNFRELEVGAVFGRTRHAMPVTAADDDGQEVAGAFFSTGDGLLRLAQATMPAMLTLDERIVRQDCLCYLMTRVRPGSWALET